MLLFKTSVKLNTLRLLFNIVSTLTGISLTHTEQQSSVNTKISISHIVFFFNVTHQLNTKKKMFTFITNCVRMLPWS